jgi:hypothetical protein
MIHATDINGNSGLYVIFKQAIKENNIHMLDLYVSLILENDRLSNQQKFELISAKNFDNIAGLYVALQKKQYIATKYIETILESCYFTLEQKFELILAQGENNTNSIYNAIKNNNLFILREVIICILNIISRDSGYFYPQASKYRIYNDCVDVLDKYISFILNTDICNIQQKQEICNIAGSYKNYGKLIHLSGLSIEDKNKILSNNNV